MSKNQKGRTLLQNLLLAILFLAVVCIAIFAVAFVYFSRAIPDPRAIVNRRVNESTKIFDSTGEALLYEIHGEEKRTIISWEEIPENVKLATLAAEDINFYNHRGIDARGIIRAFFTNLKEKRISQGGSTITQQLVGNALIGREKTLSRKFKEILLSLEVERRFSKDEIFWMYLNQIPYGSNAYGIEAAAQTFFDKSARDLTVNEAAVLASLPKGPSLYSPSGDNRELLVARKDMILDRLKDVEFITEEEYQEAVNEKLEFKKTLEKFDAPHFVIMIKQYLVEKYGDDFVEKGGLNVYTTLDKDLQKIAEEAINKFVERNKASYNAHNTALVATDPKTGYLLAMVGSRDYFGESEPEGCIERVDCKFEGNFNVALGYRQPGSSFKPFAYSVLIDKGYPDSTILFDVPTEFNPECSANGLQEEDKYGNKCYHPKNYSGTYKGPVSLRNALAQSLNVPSVKVLYLAGIDGTIDLAKKMGITTLNDRSRYGLSLVLGGGEIRLLDMVSAFGVFANDGVKNEMSFIVKIEDAESNILEQSAPRSERILNSQVARMISNILSDNNARGPVFGYNSSLLIPGESVAVKTGTTQENRDGWTIGYTPNLVAGVWSGNNDNSKMSSNADGVVVAAPIWKEFMTRALKSFPDEDFIFPEPMLADKLILNGQYILSADIIPQIHDTLFYINKRDPLGPFPVDPYGDEQFKNWEEAVLLWSQNRFFAAPN